MLRLTSLRLSIDHAPDDLRAAILKQLGIAPHALKNFTVIKRGRDARKKAKIFYVYTLDIAVDDENELLARRQNANIQPAPDTGSNSWPRPRAVSRGPW